MSKLWQSMKSCSQTKGYSKWLHMRTRGRGIEKLITGYLLTKRMALKRCCRIFLCIGPTN